MPGLTRNKIAVILLGVFCVNPLYQKATTEDIPRFIFLSMKVHGKLAALIEVEYLAAVTITCCPNVFVTPTLLYYSFKLAHI